MAVILNQIANRASNLAYKARNLSRRYGIDIGLAYPERSPGSFFMLRILPRTGVAVVIDVGARVGEFGEELRHSGYTGPIVSFEPVPGNIELLQRVAGQDPNWHVYPYAIGAVDGTASINVTQHSAFNSLLEPNEVGREKFGSQVAVVEKVEVPVRRLDTVLPSILEELNCVNAKIFLKTDTQGYEMEVLRGAKGLLENIPACRVEVTFKPSYKGAPSFREMLDFMAGLGYDLSALFQVFYEGGLALAEGDAFFVRTVRGPSSPGHQSVRSS